MRTPSFLRRIATGLRAGGFRWLTGAVGNRLIPPRLAMTTSVLNSMTDRNGLEIGGPSRVFEAHRLLPIYAVAARVDNVNYSPQTTWEDNLCDGGEFRFDSQRPPGTQWLRDAVALSQLGDGAYDFVISSHCLEHVANPLRALHEWHRVTRPGGHLLLMLPDPARTFDRRRPITTIEHLRNDLAHNTGEDDATHLPEVLELHDLTRDPASGSAEEFRARTVRNQENRCVHHHVFNLELMAAMLPETGWNVLALEKVRPLHLVAFARKPST